MSVFYIGLWVNPSYYRNKHNFCVAIKYNKRLQFTDYTRGNIKSKNTKDKILVDIVYKVMGRDEFEVRLGYGFTKIR